MNLTDYTINRIEQFFIYSDEEEDEGYGFGFRESYGFGDEEGNGYGCGYAFGISNGGGYGQGRADSFVDINDAGLGYGLLKYPIPLIIIVL